MGGREGGLETSDDDQGHFGWHWRRQESMPSLCSIACLASLPLMTPAALDHHVAVLLQDYVAALVEVEDGYAGELGGAS